MNTGNEGQIIADENVHGRAGVLYLMGAQESVDARSVSDGRSLDVGSSQEPPAKKPRLSSVPSITSSQARRDALKARLGSQLIPHIIRAVHDLPPAELKRDAIAVMATSILVKDPEFGHLLRADSGLLTPVAHNLTAQRAAEVVRRLASLPEYRLNVSRKEAPGVIKKEQVSPLVIAALPTTPGSEPTFPVAASTPPAAEIKRPLRKPYKPRIRRETSPQPIRQWRQLATRPYLSALDRDAVQQGSQLALAKASPLRDGPVVYHVDFSVAEIAQMIDHMIPYVQLNVPRTAAALRQICTEYPVSTLLEGKLPGRAEQDIRNFCSDLLAGTSADTKNAKVFSIQGNTTPQQDEHRRETRVSTLLFARELDGNRGMGRTRRYVNFQSSFKQVHEDAISLAAEFTNCAGDISTMTWIPNQNILCGTTAHSDAHNQQYNKPGNLLLYSASRGVLLAFPDHRIPRPLVTKGENSSVAMRQSQDPWIYSSVVSSDYDAIHGLAYTSSFDKTIKVWKVDSDGGSMRAVATFQHDGNVNFVTTAKDGSGNVAAAADTTTEAVRIYTMNLDNISQSPYYTISCTRNDADGSDKWAYFPATVQWGIAPGTQHLLLVGYSPRSFSGDEQDIPVDKLNTGEIMLWDALERRQVPVMTATTANVFEVAWHPTVCGFVVGTSPCGLHVDHGVRTQVHVFRQDNATHADGAYSEYQKLDCFASDINELSIVPNSLQSSYITAACTDGKVYVWDMSQGDKPIHVLKHGTPLDGVLRPEDREREDTGVKFTTWGRDPSRLYTGSSDGVVKVWNIRNRRKPFVRDLLRAPGPISCGGFSPDHSKLAIGDATGRLFLFSVAKDEKLEKQFTMTLPGTDRRIRRPKPFTPHPEPPAPVLVQDADVMVLDDADEDVDAATYARRRYLDTQQVTIHRNPVIGAVQGPQYAASGLFLRDAHLDDDPAAPLLTKFERLQQESRHSVLGGPASRRPRSLRRLAPASLNEATETRHRANVARDFDVAMLAEADVEELVRAGALLDIGDEGEDWGFAYEESLMEEEEED
ncbi:hypothetical protein PWT90_08260 [Aphanocladium album]|nr:hypothetical protein PWT90_08260 [Aphanocladium album]